MSVYTHYTPKIGEEADDWLAPWGDEPSTENGSMVYSYKTPQHGGGYLTEQRVTLRVTKRVNKASLASRPLTDIKDDLTSFFASHLVRQMMEAGVLRVSSEVSKATGAVTFTAELVCLKEEKQNNATTTKTTKDSSD
jgi:hypothetical protein